MWQWVCNISRCLGCHNSSCCSRLNTAMIPGTAAITLPAIMDLLHSRYGRQIPPRRNILNKARYLNKRVFPARGRCHKGGASADYTSHRVEVNEGVNVFHSPLLGVWESQQVTLIKLGQSLTSIDHPPSCCVQRTTSTVSCSVFEE